MSQEVNTLQEGVPTGSGLFHTIAFCTFCMQTGPHSDATFLVTLSSQPEGRTACYGLAGNGRVINISRDNLHIPETEQAWLCIHMAAGTGSVQVSPILQGNALTTAAHPVLLSGP